MVIRLGVKLYKGIKGSSLYRTFSDLWHIQAEESKTNVIDCKCGKKVEDVPRPRSLTEAGKLGRRHNTGVKGEHGDVLSFIAL